MLYQNIARNVCLSSIFLPMSSSFVSRDLVVMKLIKERCKLADAQSVRDQKDEFINRWDLKGKHLPMRNSFVLCFLQESYGVVLEKNGEIWIQVQEICCA